MFLPAEVSQSCEHQVCKTVKRPRKVIFLVNFVSVKMSFLLKVSSNMTAIATAKTSTTAAGIFPKTQSIAARNFATTQIQNEKYDCKVLIAGGGSGGCALAAKLSSKLGANKVIVLEPEQRHYYQPMFTLIGGGMKTLQQSYRPMAQVLPKNITWLQDKAAEFEPRKNTVITSKGDEIKYDILLIAMGMQLYFEKIPGLVEALSVPNGNVSSIYSPLYVERTLPALRQITEGNAIFTYPASPVKCPGAPQKIVYISEHYFRKTNKRQRINVVYNSALPVIFGVKHYADALWPMVKKRNINVNLRKNLIEVKHQENIAVFEDLDNPGRTFEEKYALLHAVPPMSAPDELKQSEVELVNEAGFVNVNQDTMQSTNYDNVFAIGDCANSPNSKTAAAAAAQSPVVFRNILATINGKRLTSVYDGYASCPLVTGYRTCILAEFDYQLRPLETFPFAQNKERYTMFYLKKDFMPWLYWHIMLNGYWNGPAMMRNIMSIFKLGK